MILGDFELRPGTRPGLVWIADLCGGESGDFSAADLRDACGFDLTDADQIADRPRAARDLATFFAAKF